MLSHFIKIATWILALGFILTACASPDSQTTPIATDSPSPVPVSATPTLLLPDEPPPSGAAGEFSTDFSKHTVPYDEILSGGPPKDGIPALDDPKFIAVEEAAGWLEDQEPVVFVAVGDDVRAYPIQILMWHEIVNDTVGGVPLMVSFCPLCNTAIAFERTMDDGRVFDFGTTGRLRNSNLIMYDRQTETWWQQATGEAIAGELTGTQLVYYPAAIISWADFKAQYPDGKVLSRDTGFNRDYGRNPYLGYDDVERSPFLYQGDPTPGQLPPMARVLTLDLNGEAVAYPYDVLSTTHVINDEVGAEPVVIFWAGGTASALDASRVAGGQDVGAAAVYSRLLDGRMLEFAFEGGALHDEQTGSTWNVLGQAIDGELRGKQLSPLVAINHFWFSWAAFRPETRIFQP